MINRRGLLRTAPLSHRLSFPHPVLLVGVGLGLALLASLLAPRVRREREGLVAGRLAPYRPEWISAPESLRVVAGDHGLPSAVGSVVRLGDAFVLIDPAGAALFHVGRGAVNAVREYEPGVPLRWPMGLAVAARRVWVLDAAAREVFTWTFDLVSAGRFRLQAEAGTLSLPRGFGVDRFQRVYVLARETALATGRARWVLDRYTGDGSGRRRIWQAAAASMAEGFGDLFDEPVLGVSPGGEVLVARAQSYEVVALGPEGDTLWMSARRDAPRFPVSDEDRRAYVRALQGLPGSLRHQLPIPRSWPPVAWIAWLDPQRWIAGIRATDSTQHVEIVGRDGEALGRVTQEPSRAALSYTAGLLVQAIQREEDLLLEWRRVEPADP